MRFSPIFSLILSYMAIVILFSAFLPQAWLLSFLFQFFFAFFVEKLSKIEIVVVLSIQSMVGVAFYVVGREVTNFGSNVIFPPIWFEAFIVITAMFLAYALKLGFDLFIIRRLKLKERVGKSLR